MKAVVCDRYGSAGVLGCTDVEQPAPGDDDVLIRVIAASVNAADLETLTGTFMARAGGLFRPKYRILGTDVAGVVERVGRNVQQASPGDEVLGDLSQCGYGAFAEYVSVPANVVTPKPEGVPFEVAAALPTAGILALQGLRDKRRLEPGDRVLVNGAGGGVGTFAVQIAKHLGAEVTGVDRAEKLDLLRSLGADHVLDYARVDFCSNGQQYDAILDVAAHRSVAEYRRALRSGGVCVLVGGSVARILQAGLFGSWGSKSGKKVGLLTSWTPNRPSDMALLLARIETGDISPVIESVYTLDRLADALRRLATGRVAGKLVISMRDGGMS